MENKGGPKRAQKTTIKRGKESGEERRTWDLGLIPKKVGKKQNPLVAAGLQGKLKSIG